MSLDIDSRIPISSVMSTLQSLPPDMGKIAGPLLIGHLLHLALFGVLSVQVYIYYLAFPLDPLNRKALVYIMYIVELVQAILMSTMAFKEFASGFGNLRTLQDMSLLWFAVPVISSLVAAVVQMFYAYRIRMLSHSIFLPALIVLIALIQTGGGIALGVFGEQQPYFPAFRDARLVTAVIWNGGSALCDVIIAASMTYYLSRLNSEWKQTQRRVRRVMRLIIETGTLTATIAVINLIMFLLVPNHPNQPAYYQTTSAVLGKMYSTTMMVVLNSRIEFAQNNTASHELSSMFRPEIRPKPHSTTLSTISTSRGGISVTREHWEDYTPPGTKEIELPNISGHVRASYNA